MTLFRQSVVSCVSSESKILVVNVLTKPLNKCFWQNLHRNIIKQSSLYARNLSPSFSDMITLTISSRGIVQSSIISNLATPLIEHQPTLQKYFCIRYMLNIKSNKFKSLHTLFTLKPDCHIRNKILCRCPSDRGRGRGGGGGGGGRGRGGGGKRFHQYLIGCCMCAIWMPSDKWIPCPVDPSHTVLEKNLEDHLKKCPFLKYAKSLSLQPFYCKGINSGEEEIGVEDNVTSKMKRKAVYDMNACQISELISKIKFVHGLICSDIEDSHKVPESCAVWTNHEIDRKLPFQEKHVSQQASILGNLEDIGVLKSPAADAQKKQSSGNGSCVDDDDDDILAVVEFGAGRGYLTQVLADCYGIKKVFLVERRSYKLKADRSLRQIESLTLERLRIDIEDLNLNAVESLKGIPYLAIGKHICGPATDMTLRCLANHGDQNGTAEGTANAYLRGLALTTCCHHLCQWKNYINKRYMSHLGFDREYFHAMTWFTSWAVDATSHLDIIDDGYSKDCDACGAEGTIRNMSSAERAVLGFMCKDIIDMGRLMWIKEHGLYSRLVKYVPSNISPENHLLIAAQKNTPS